MEEKETPVKGCIDLKSAVRDSLTREELCEMIQEKEDMDGQHKLYDRVCIHLYKALHGFPDYPYEHTCNDLTLTRIQKIVSELGDVRIVRAINDVCNQVDYLTRRNNDLDRELEMARARIRELETRLNMETKSSNSECNCCNGY